MYFKYSILFLNFLGLLVLTSPIQSAEPAKPTEQVSGSSSSIKHANLTKLEHFLHPLAAESLAAFDAAFEKLNTKDEKKWEESFAPEKHARTHSKAKFNPYKRYVEKPSHKKIKF